MDKITFELIEKYNIEDGYFDNIATAKYAIPTHRDIGKVYKRLIIDVAHFQNKDYIEALIEVYNSWLSRKIEDFNSGVYYESPAYFLNRIKKEMSCKNLFTCSCSCFY